MISFFLKFNQSLRIFLMLMYIGIVAALSLLPMRDLPQIPQFPGFDKVVHFCMYFGFSILFCWSTKTEHNYSWLFLIIPLTIGWGLLMEMLQLRMHYGRSFSLYDELANATGVFGGVLVYVLLTRRFAVTDTNLYR